MATKLLLIKKALFTGNTVSGSAIINNIPSTTGFLVGDVVLGTGVPLDTYILSVDSAVQITLTESATATNNGLTFNLMIEDITVAKALNSDTVDGYHADESNTISTIPVRSAAGIISGSIDGNAATVTNGVYTSRTIAGVDLQNNITGTELTAGLDLATESLQGAMSPTDKTNLNTIYNSFVADGTDGGAIVNQIGEVLAYFTNYPEGLDLVTILAAKQANITDGTGLTFTGDTLNHTNSVTADTAEGTATTTLGYDGTFTVPTITYDAQGHITSWSTNTLTMPSYPTVNDGALTLATSGLGLSGSDTFTANQAAGTTFTVSSNAVVAGTASTIVYRDTSGDVTADTKFYYGTTAYTEYNATDKSIDFVFTD